MTSSLSTRAGGPALSRTCRSRRARFSRSTRKSSRVARNNGAWTRDGLEIHAEQDTRLVALEIDQVKRTDGGGGVARDLRAPCRRDPGALREPEVDRRSNEK